MTIQINAIGTYAQISTSDMINTAKSILNPSDWEFNQRVYKGTTIVTATKARHEIHLPDGSIILPRLCFTNSEIQGRALTITMGAYRTLCANGLVISGIGNAISQKVIHRIGPKVSEFCEQFAAKLETTNSALTETLQETVDFMERETRLSPEEETVILGNLFLQNAIIESTFDIATRQYGRRPQDGHTLWGLYNYVQELNWRHTPKGLARENRNNQLCDKINHAYIVTTGHKRAA